MIIKENANGDDWEISQIEEKAVNIYKNRKLFKRLTVTKEKLGADELERILHLYQLEDE